MSLSRDGIPRCLPEFHRRKIRVRDDRADMLVRLYLSFFSISKLVLLAKRHHYNYVCMRRLRQNTLRRSNRSSMQLQNCIDRMLSLTYKGIYRPSPQACSKADSSMFVHRGTKDVLFFFCTYVDDIILTWDNSTLIDAGKGTWPISRKVLIRIGSGTNRFGSSFCFKSKI